MSRPPAAVGRAMLAAGAVVVAASILLALPLFGPRPLALVPLLLGSLLLSFGAALQPPQAEDGPGPGQRLRSFRQLANWAIPLAVLAIGWTLSHFLNFAIDVTKTQVNTLAAESLQVVSAVDVDVRVVSFLPEGERAALELSSLVARYSAANPRVQAEPKTLKRAADVEVAQALGIAALLPLGGPNVVVTAVGGQPVPLRFDAGLLAPEELLTNALRSATTTKPKVRGYVVAGHGEPELRDSGPLGLSLFREALSARGVELVSLPLIAAGGRLPADAQLLMVLPPSSPFEPAEIEALSAFVNKGGHLLLLLEPDVAQPLQQTLAGLFGVTILNDIVVDESPFSSLLGGVDTATGSTQLGHAISQPLQGALTHFVRATALTTSPLPGVEVVAVISTGSQARAPKTNAQGPLPLLIAADGQVPAGAGGLLGRAVVVADTSFVQNAGIGLGANRDLAINSALWLAEDESFIRVRPRQKTGALIFLSPSSRELLAFVLLFLIPVGLAAVGAVLGALRR